MISVAIVEDEERDAGILQRCLEKYGSRRVYASDEFYIKAELPMPDADFYGDFLQLDNGVGMCALLKSEFMPAWTFISIKLHFDIHTSEQSLHLVFLSFSISVFYSHRKSYTCERNDTK